MRVQEEGDGGGRRGGDRVAAVEVTCRRVKARRRCSHDVGCECVGDGGGLGSEKKVEGCREGEGRVAVDYGVEGGDATAALERKEPRRSWWRG